MWKMEDDNISPLFLLVLNFVVIGSSLGGILLYFSKKIREDGVFVGIIDREKSSGFDFLSETAVLLKMGNELLAVSLWELDESNNVQQM
jgi:hypothetical protein